MLEEQEMCVCVCMGALLKGRSFFHVSRIKYQIVRDVAVAIAVAFAKRL